ARGLPPTALAFVLRAAVWISGPSKWATDSRRWMAPYIARPEIAFGAAAALLLLLVWWGPTIQTQRWHTRSAVRVGDRRAPVDGALHRPTRDRLRRRRCAAPPARLVGSHDPDTALAA